MGVEADNNPVVGHVGVHAGVVVEPGGEYYQVSCTWSKLRSEPGVGGLYWVLEEMGVGVGVIKDEGGAVLVGVNE